MFNEKEYLEIAAAIKNEAEELHNIIDERGNTCIKIMKFLIKIGDKARQNAIPVEVSIQGRDLSWALEKKIDDAFLKTSSISRVLDEMYMQVNVVRNMKLEDDISHVAFDDKHGAPPVSIGVSKREHMLIKQLIKEDREQLDKDILKAQKILAEVRERLPETEVYFSEDMFTEKEMAQITGEQLQKVVKEKVEAKKKTPVNSKKTTVQDKATAQERKALFFSSMKTFLTNTATVIKNVIVTVAKKVVDVAKSLKDKFFAKMKTFLTPKTA